MTLIGLRSLEGFSEKVVSKMKMLPILLPSLLCVLMIPVYIILVTCYRRKHTTTSRIDEQHVLLAPQRARNLDPT